MYPTLDKLFRLCDEVNDVESPRNAATFSARVMEFSDYLSSNGIQLAELAAIEFLAAQLSDSELRLMANAYAVNCQHARHVAGQRGVSRVRTLAEVMFDLLNEGPPR